MGWLIRRSAGGTMLLGMFLAGAMGVPSIGCDPESASTDVQEEVSETVTRIGANEKEVEASSKLAQACITSGSEFLEGPCYIRCGVLEGYCSLGQSAGSATAAKCVATSPSGETIELTTMESARSQEEVEYKKQHPCAIPTCGEDGNMSEEPVCGAEAGVVISGACMCEVPTADLPFGGEVTDFSFQELNRDMLLFIVRNGTIGEVVRHSLDCPSEDLTNCLHVLTEKFFLGDQKMGMSVDVIPEPASKSKHYLAAWIDTPPGTSDNESFAVIRVVEVDQAPGSVPKSGGSPSKLSTFALEDRVLRIVPAAISIDRALLAVETAGEGEDAFTGVSALYVKMDLTNPQWYEILDVLMLDEALRLEDVVSIDGQFQIVLSTGEEVEADGAGLGWGPLFGELLEAESDQLQERSETTSLGLKCQVGTAKAMFSSAINSLYVACTDPEGFIAVKRFGIDLELGDFVTLGESPAKTYGKGRVTGLSFAANSEESVLVVPFEEMTSAGVPEVRLTAFADDLQLRVSSTPFLPANPWGYFSPQVRTAVTDNGQRLVITFVALGRKGPFDMGSPLRLFRGVTSLEMH